MFSPLALTIEVICEMRRGSGIAAEEFAPFKVLEVEGLLWH
jgi:hypothetical protein